MRNVQCNLCGADDYTVVFPKGYAQVHQIVRCNRCGLMYANPQELVDCLAFSTPEGAEVYDIEGGRQHFQKQHVQIPELFDLALLPFSRQYFQKQHVQIPDYLRVLRVLDTLLPNKGKLLEIGSFLGILLDRIRADGWNGVGLEPNPGPANYARSKYHLPIVNGVLPNPKLLDGEFDAVIMLHVIEHMPDPSENLREIRRIMKPGGILVVETPRFDSLMFKLLGHRERSINNCQGHIFFFTVPTLRQTVEKHGFEVLQTELVGRTLTLDRLLYNVALITRSPRAMNWAGRIGQRLGLGKIRLHLNMRDMQRIYARAK